MFDRVNAVIHLDHLIHNFQKLKHIHQEKRVLAVVKADAYGHGAIACARHLEAHGCDYFAVTDMMEAIELREAGIKSPILIFGKTNPEHIDKLHDYHLTQTVDSYAYGQALNEKKRDIDIHIILDTGMSRFGVYCHQVDDHLKAIKDIKDILALKHLKMKGIYTHFALADEDQDVSTKKQYDMFTQVTSALEKYGYDLGIKHCSNSASTLKYPLHQMDMVRVGIAMYGYPPVADTHDFLPVMDVYAKVIAIRDINIGDGVSYGWTYKADKAITVASIAIGYADGYFRMFSGKDYFLYKGYKLPVLGRVCMGVTMVDVSGIEIHVGDAVTIFGQDKSLTVMADMVGTITYELLTNMRKARVVYTYKS